MLPMFEPKKVVSVISARRGKPDVEVSAEVEAPGSEIDPGLKEAAEDMLRAFQDKSVLGMAMALKAAFECCDAAPHVEGEHIEGEE